VHQLCLRGQPELLRNSTHPRAEVCRIDVEAEDLDEWRDVGFVAEVDEHTVAVFGGAAGHVVKEDWGEAGVEGAVDEAEGEELG